MHRDDFTRLGDSNQKDLAWTVCRALVKHMLQYQERQGRLDLAFQALADVSRRAMVERLVRGPASVSELAAPFQMSLSAVMQHLRLLEASGLVRTEKAGRVRTCRIDTATLRTAEDWMSQQRVAWEQRFDRLEEFLASTPGEPSNRKRRR